MKKRVSYSSSFSIISFFSHMSLTLLLSFSLQQSDASKRSIDEEITDQPAKIRKILTSSKELQTCYGDLNILSEDILAHHILLHCNSNIIKVSRSFFMLVTGYNCEHIFDQGFENRPVRPVCYIMSNASIDFKNLLQKIEQIPSFVWYSLIRKVKNLSPIYWPYLTGSYINTVKVSQDQLSDKDVHTLSQNLLKTQVHTLYLKSNQISTEGVQALSQSLQGILYLKGKQIDDKGAHARCVPKKLRV